MTYFQHGRRHGPNGTDPIPFPLGVEYVYLVSNGLQSLPDTSVKTPFDFQGGYTSGGAPALTETPAVFELAAQAGGTYAGKHGLQFNEVGNYLAFLSVVVSTELTDATQKVQHLEYNIEGAGSFGASSWLFSGNFDASVYGNQSIAQLWSVNAVPTLIGVGAANARGTGAVDAQAYLIVVRLGEKTMAELTGGSAVLY